MCRSLSFNGDRRIMASIIKVDTIQTAAGGTPTAADLGLNVSGSLITTTQYKPSGVTVSASSYTDAITQAHTFSSTASKFFAILTSYSNTHDGSNYTYFTARLNWQPSSGTGVTSNTVRIGENQSQSSDSYTAFTLSLSGDTESTTGNFRVQGFIGSDGGGTGGVSLPTLTIFEFA